MEAVLRSHFVIIWLRPSLKERPGLVAVSKVLGASLPFVTPKSAETGRRKCQTVNTWGWEAGGHGTQVHVTLRIADFMELVCIQGMRAQKPLQPQATGWEEPRAISGMGGDKMLFLGGQKCPWDWTAGVFITFSWAPRGAERWKQPISVHGRQLVFDSVSNSSVSWSQHPWNLSRHRRSPLLCFLVSSWSPCHHSP